MIKTAIFGGKFDPPHLAHQIIIFLLFAKHKIDEVFVVPSFSHAFGYDSTSFELRLKMADFLAKPWGNSVKILDIEKNIGKEPVYSIDLLEALNMMGGDREFYFVIGEDNYKLREKWKDFDKIEAMAKIIVIGRGTSFENYFPMPDISSSLIREMILAGKDVSHLLPDGLSEFILKKKIY